MNAAKDGGRRKPTKTDHSIIYEDQFLLNKSGRMFPTYFHEKRCLLFVLKQNAPKNTYLRRVLR
jgi:hypothetical protein